MNIAYLINQYPKVSHSFIRREIQALETLGMRVDRYTIRSTPLDSLTGPEDQREYELTTALLSADYFSLLLVAGRTVLMHPVKFFRAFGVAIALGRKSRRGVLRHIIYLVEACKLRQLLEEHNIAHVHAHFGTNSTVVALLCSMLGGPSYSFTVHGPEEFDDPVGLSLGKKIQMCSFVVAISSFGKSQLMRWCSAKEWGKIKIVHCTVDDTFLLEKKHKIPDNNRLVCVGRLCEQKGQLLLLDALKILDKEKINFTMVFAGDGEMREIIEDRIKEYHLEQKVIITGWLNGEQVKKEIVNSRAMVLPSFAEGLPVVLMESLSLCRPVVSTNIAGIPELVIPGENGWLVPAGCVEDLVSVLKEVLVTDLQELYGMGKKGAKRITQQHNAAIEAKKLLNYMVE